MTRRLSMHSTAIMAAVTLSLMPGPLLANDAADIKKLDLILKPTTQRLESGAHVNVVLAGSLDASGKMTALTITTSSGSAALDKDILSKFEGGRLSTKGLTPDMKRIQLSLTIQNFELKDGKTIVYPCDQVVRDINWSRSNLPDWDVEQEYLYGIIRTIGLLIDEPRFKFLMNSKAYREAWTTAIEGCRRNTRASFLPLLAAAGNSGGSVK